MACRAPLASSQVGHPLLGCLHYGEGAGPGFEWRTFEHQGSTAVNQTLTGAALGSLLGLAALGAPHGAAAGTLYSTDFSGPAAVAGGVTAVVDAGGGVVQNVGAGVPGYYTGDVFRNATGGSGSPGDVSSWSLSGIGAHDLIDVSFTLAFLDSWDSDNGSPSPDDLQIFLDDVEVLRLTSAGASGTNVFLGGGTEVAFGALFNSAGFFYDQDRIVDMSTAPALRFAHTASTLKLSIRASGAGWQGGDDESWGIDNLTITSLSRAGAVPEPATWAMMILGFGGVGATVRRRRLRLA